MTAEQELSFSNSLHNFQHQDVNVDTELVHWAQGEMQEKMNLEAVTSKKRMWQLIEEEAEQHSLTLPLKKSPRKNEDQVTKDAKDDEQVELWLTDTSKLKQKNILLAYKRIWNNMDLSKPEDAKLEPFVWRKIRQYQQNK